MTERRYEFRDPETGRTVWQSEAGNMFSVPDTKMSRGEVARLFAFLASELDMAREERDSALSGLASASGEVMRMAGEMNDYDAREVRLKKELQEMRRTWVAF